MGKTLKLDISQTQPCAGSEEEAVLNLERTTDHFRREVHLILRHYGLTSTQYNALRILRGMGPGGLTCTDLGSRLVSTDPDITRLLDRLAKQKLVRRRRDLRDRRVVLTEITEEGMQLVEIISPVLETHIRELMRHMQRDRLQLLIELLGEARRPHEQESAATPSSSAAPKSSQRAG